MRSYFFYCNEHYVYSSTCIQSGRSNRVKQVLSTLLENRNNVVELLRLRKGIHTTCDLDASAVDFNVGFQKIDIDFFWEHAKCPIDLVVFGRGLVVKPRPKNLTDADE